MNDAIAQMKEVFKTEVYELLEEMESALLTLEENPEDTELIGRVFRAMHTIKGSSSMFGSENIAEFTHDIETTFDLVREGKLKISKELIYLSLEACDQIRLMLNSIDMEESNVDKNEISRILNSFSKYLNPQEIKSSSQNKQENSTTVETDLLQTFLIELKLEPYIFSFGTNPALLLNELKELGESRISCLTDNIPSIEEMEPELCFVTWKIVLKTTEGINAIKDVFIFVEDDCDLKINLFDDGTDKEKEVDVEILAQIFFEKGKVLKRDHKKIFTKKTPSKSEVLIESKNNIEDNTTIPKNAESTNVVAKALGETHLVSSIRVASGKLDSLVNLVGELVIARARLSQFATKYQDSELTVISEDIERLTDNLRETSMNMRLIPIGTLFNKFKRLAHDLARDHGKEVELVIKGAQTELDKTVIEKLNDPLVHIIRNAIDHGIETIEKRTKNNKLPKGVLELNAFHSGADVVIQITDDGNGIDAEIVGKKGVEKGIIASTAGMSDDDILKLIFAPGFSTKDTVTSLSGRGVGMDVVKRNIDALRGTIDIISESGFGTTITMRLPLTLGIIEGLLVKVADAHYVFPLSIVEECLELKHKNGKHPKDDSSKENRSIQAKQSEEGLVPAKQREDGRRLIEHRNKALPFIRLREHFSLGRDVPDIEQVLVIKDKEQIIGIAVDEIIGEQQIVIKSLGKMYKHVEGLSGATILGDGNLALILDTQKIVANAELVEEEIISKYNG